jgi:hypothetical protein
MSCKNLVCLLGVSSMATQSLHAHPAMSTRAATLGEDGHGLNPCQPKQDTPQSSAGRPEICLLFRLALLRAHSKKRMFSSSVAPLFHRRRAGPPDISERSAQSTSPRSPGQVAGGRAHLRSHGAAASTTIRRDLATSRPCTETQCHRPHTSRARNTPEAPA